MKAKKNPKVSLENFSKIFFQIGLVLSLFIIYQLIEHKTYERVYSDGLELVTMNEEFEEEIPIVPIQEMKPPPKNTPTIVEKVTIVEDDLKVEETIVESTETDESEAVVVNISDVVEVEEKERIEEDIPFVLIEDVPIYPGCKGNKQELKNCFSEKITEYFSKNFNTNLATELGLQAGKKKLYVVFKISKTGVVTDVKARGPHPTLENEVVKIIGSLPTMTPGKQRGIPVKVSYSIPITFEVRE